MNHDHYPDRHIRDILNSVKTIAIVGASANVSRPSYFVVKYLLSKGYDVLPINPGRAGGEIAGAHCYGSLAEAQQTNTAAPSSVAGQNLATSQIASPQPGGEPDGSTKRQIDMVEIFRNSKAAYPVVEEALKLDPLPKIIWMQLSVRNDEAAQLAEAKGITVIMNRCPKIEYARLCGEIGWVGVNSGVITSKRPKLAKGFQRFKV